MRRGQSDGVSSSMSGSATAGKIMAAPWLVQARSPRAVFKRFGRGPVSRTSRMCWLLVEGRQGLARLWERLGWEPRHYSSRVVVSSEELPRGPLGCRSTRYGSLRVPPARRDVQCVSGAAGQLLAGLDGILNQIDPTENGFGPIDQNIFAWTDEQRKKIRPLPSSLRQVCEALEHDHDFLLAGGVFDEGQIADWISHKLNEEYYQVRNRPHPYEMALYFDV